jgi:hypothetical protein
VNIRAWAAAIPDEFYKWGTLNAYPRVPLPYIDVLERVQGMTTPSNMHLLNLAVQHMGAGECYMEVGTWRGSTLIGALLGNAAHGIAIDNDTMDEHDEDDRSSGDVWEENVAAFGMTDRSVYLDGTVPGIFEDLRIRQPVGVYLFDGDKSTPEAAYDGIIGAIPYLAPEALIFVDDGNEINIRQAVHQVHQETRGHSATIIDIPTPGNCWPCFWNGVLVLAWKA